MKQPRGELVTNPRLFRGNGFYVPHGAAWMRFETAQEAVAHLVYLTEMHRVYRRRKRRRRP
jgi:hypothetical protein